MLSVASTVCSAHSRQGLPCPWGVSTSHFPALLRSLVLGRVSVYLGRVCPPTLQGSRENGTPLLAPSLSLLGRHHDSHLATVLDQVLVSACSGILF